MKFFAFVLLFAAVAYAADDKMRSSYGGSAPSSSYGSAPAAASSYGSAPASSSSYGSAPASSPSYKSASYGGGSSSSYGSAQSIPAPPCSSNYLFSCQPSLQPVPCSQPAPSYGSSGSYATNYPIYALPQ